MGLPADAASFLEAMRKRYACKLYDGRPIPPELERYIFECGRLSPSSFGIEHWRFVAVRAPSTLCETLYEACFGQYAVRTAGLVLSILVRRSADYGPDSPFIIQRSERFPGGHGVFRADYVGYWEFLKAEGRIEEWARAQSYIACANMMTGAAAAGIDSCAIEGYKEGEVLSALGMDPSHWRVGLIVVFGFAAEERRGKIRESLDSLVEYRS